MVHITLAPDGLVECPPGKSLLQALEPTPWALPQTCDGQGTCGRCRLRVQSPEAMGAREQATLGEALIRQGYRLACCLHPETDLIVKPGIAQRNPAWRALALPPITLPPGQGVKAVLDLGTSNLVLALADYRRPRLWGPVTCPNPQGPWGQDVLTRLALAAAAPDAAQAMQTAVISQVRLGLEELCQQAGLPLALSGMLVLGNSAMISLLCRSQSQALLEPDNRIARLQWPSHGPWAGEWGLAEQDLHLLSPLAGFIGSDLVGGLVASGLLAQTQPGLFIDLGTNSELALWNGEQLWLTSAAGGPAFEASGMPNGMDAGPGAIYRLDAAPGGGMQAEWLTPGPPKGLCGAGYLSLFALLLQQGRLRPNGRLAAGQDPYCLQVGGEEFFVGGREVDVFQQAKAAIGTGVELLCRRAGLQVAELQSLTLTGAFGNELHLPQAVALGLLPDLPLSRMRLLPQAPLQGGLRLLGADARAPALPPALAQAQVMHLASQPEFTDLFFHHLFLRPFGQAESWSY